MSATGMSVASCSEVMDAQAELKKVTTKLQYISFGINIEQEGSKLSASFALHDQVERDDSKSNEEAWNAMISSLPPSSGRQIVFDVKFNKDDGRIIQKPILITWCPDTLRIKEKMMIGSNKDSVKRELEGVQHDIHASDADELEYSIVKGLLA